MKNWVIDLNADLGEGAGFDWFDLDRLFREDITEKVERDLKLFISKV